MNGIKYALTILATVLSGGVWMAVGDSVSICTVGKGDHDVGDF